MSWLYFSRLLRVHDRPFDSTSSRPLWLDPIQIESTHLWFHFIHDQESIQDQEVSRTHVLHSHVDLVTFQAFSFRSWFLQGSPYHFYRSSLLISIVLSTEIPILFQRNHFRVRFDDFISRKLSWISHQDLLIILIKSSLSEIQGSSYPLCSGLTGNYSVHRIASTFVLLTVTRSINI